MGLLTHRSEDRVGSLLSPGDRDALDTLMNTSAVRVDVPDAAGRLAVVWFMGEGSWPMWGGIHMPLPREDEAPQDQDVTYGWAGGNFQRVGSKLLGFGGQAELVRHADGEVRVTQAPFADCEICPPGEGLEVLSERLGLDAERLRMDDRPVTSTMRALAGEALRTWPLEDRVLQAAAGIALDGLGSRAR